VSRALRAPQTAEEKQGIMTMAKLTISILALAAVLYILLPQLTWI
jgi:hypothetical protein